VHKEVPEYAITEDDVELVVEKVHDHAEEAHEEGKKKRHKILQEMT
jgi:NACalpha-BTF3-like transcription factor